MLCTLEKHDCFRMLGFNFLVLLRGSRPFTFEDTILIYGLGLIAWTCTVNLMGVLGPCTHTAHVRPRSKKWVKKLKPQIFFVFWAQIVWRPKSKIRELSFLRDPYLPLFWNFPTNSLTNVGVGILVIDIGQNGILRYGHFCGFLEDKMVNFGPIDI